MTYDIDVSVLQSVLMTVAVEGAALDRMAGGARAGGDEAARQFGTAVEAAEAFAGFWAPREDLGQRVASLVFRKADAVAEAAQAFVEADGEMGNTALRYLAEIHTGYAPPVGRPRPGTAVE